MFQETPNILIFFFFVRNICQKYQQQHTNTHAMHIHFYAARWQLLCANGKCFFIMSLPHRFLSTLRDYVRFAYVCVFGLFGSPGALTFGAFNLYTELIAMECLFLCKIYFD